VSSKQLKKGLKDKLAGDQPKLDALAAITPHQARILNPLSHDPTTSLNEAEGETIPLRARIPAFQLYISIAQ
jgi:hypothetical protein